MRFRKGLTNKYPPTPFIMTQWNLNLVLTFFLCFPFEPLHSYPIQLLISWTIFLLAIMLARWVSELQMLNLKPPFTTFFPDTLVL